MIDLNKLAMQTIDLASIDNYLGLATTNPFLFILICMIIIDIITGLGATLVSRKGLDSSIAFKGWVKHSVVLITCVIVDTVAIAVKASIVGNIVTLLGITMYFTSIPGNLTACPNRSMELHGNNVADKVGYARFKVKSSKYVTARKDFWKFV